MDITMPVMDGLSALKEIKLISAGPKVIVLSALGQESIVKEAILSGAIGFIVKPFKEEHVIKVMNSL